MTTQVSATTARVREAQLECHAIGQRILAEYVDAEGQLILNDDTRAAIITVLEYSLEISKECQAWSESGGGYAEWKEMYIRGNSNEAYMSIDKTGRLHEIAAELIQLDDLEEFFELDIKPLDLSNVPFAITAQEMVLAKIKSGEL